jgi:hypothetical protein
MRETVLSQSEILLSLEEGEDFTRSALLAAMTNLVAANALLRNIFLVLQPETANEHALFLRETGWTFAGVASRDKTYLKLRVRTSEASVSQLAVDEPMLSRSPAEADAISLMKARYGNNGDKGTAA